jgi:diguanylate cyclase (GGDEF)-like protein
LIDAMNSGADGFLQKPIEGDEIEAWLAAGQRIVVMQDRLLDVQAELERRASHDALTGVVNRAGLTDSLRREISRAQRTEAPVAAVLLDVDRFKSINDSHGHNVGDEVLIEFARRCSAAVRDYDLFGRYGGEEFLLVLPGASLADARIAGQRLVDTIAARAFDTTAGPLTVTTSAGVASTAQGHRSMESLLAAADGALYHAKHTGRARVCAATDTERPRT